MQMTLPHQPDLKPIELEYPYWLGQRVSSYEGKFSALRAAIPVFERQPFRLEAGVNPNLDMILRQPPGFESGPKIPVSIVSKNYQLIQHQQILDAMISVFQEMAWEADSFDVNLTISEFGERVWVKIFLPMFVFVPGDGHPINLEVHLFNSVDRSCAMEIRLGWWRLVCKNGLWVGSYRSFRRIHNLLIPERRFTAKDFLRDEIEAAQGDRKRFERWLNTPLKTERITQWAGREVEKTWGVHAAARVFHIAMTGFDGTVKPAFEKAKPHQLTVFNEIQVPGLSIPADNLFHLVQILSWIAGRQPSLEKRFEKQQQINELIRSLENLMV